VLNASPPYVVLRFNNRIEKRLSRIRLVAARGEPRVLAVGVDGGRVDELRAAAPALAPGAYRVEWQVLSTDGHVVRGVFSFRVVP
jgi:methionine-rich copper-binding protein CopC